MIDFSSEGNILSSLGSYYRRAPRAIDTEKEAVLNLRNGSFGPIRLEVIYITNLISGVVHFSHYVATL